MPLAFHTTSEMLNALCIMATAENDRRKTVYSLSAKRLTHQHSLPARRWNFAGEHASASAAAAASSAPQFHMPSLHAVVSHRSWVGLRASTICVIFFVTSIFCTALPPRLEMTLPLDPALLRHHPPARPELHQASVALGPLLAPLRSQRVFFPHLGPGSTGRLLSSGLFPRPSWRFQLRVVHGILRNVLALASLLRRNGTRDILLSTHAS